MKHVAQEARRRYVVAPVSDLPPGARRLIRAGEKSIVVFNIGGEYFAINDRCPHGGGSLAAGVLTGLVESDRPGCYRYSRKGEILRCHAPRLWLHQCEAVDLLLVDEACRPRHAVEYQGGGHHQPRRRRATPSRRRPCGGPASAITRWWQA